MGQCVSSGGAVSEALAAAPRAATALVLLPTGELREYPRPATAARVLGDCSVVEGEKGWILCDADGMGFEGPVAAVGAAEELRAGQIYFVLPAEARRRGLRREEVAALAVRASAALSAAAAGSGAVRRRRGSVAPLVFAPPEEQSFAAAYKAAPCAGKRRPAGRGRHQRFASDLTAIPECEMSE